MIEIVGTELNQWDVGRVVQITGVEAEYAHFANKGDSKAVIMGVVDIEAKIPDYLLQTGKPLCVYAVKDGITIESKTFYVKHRERPENYVYEGDQRNYIYELITNAQTAIDEANQAAENAYLAVESANTSVVKANAAAENANKSVAIANEAADSANIAAKNANEAASKAAHTAKSLMVIGEANGASISLGDAIDQHLVGLRIFGKTTQNGVPTPEAPVDLVSAGDIGSIDVMVATGKNLLAKPFLLGVHSQSGYSKVNNKVISTDGFCLKAGTYVISGAISDSLSLYINGMADTKTTNGYQRNIPGRVFDIPSDGLYNIQFNKTDGNSFTDAEILTLNNSAQIEAGSTPTEYEPHKGQTLTISTPSGLPGIPVASGGNYADANGQQWICDEIDFARGVYVQRVGVVSKKMRQYSLQAMPIQNGLFQVLDFKVKPFSPVMSNLFIEGYTQNVNYTISTNRGNNDYAYFYYREYATTEELISAKGEVTLAVVYVLENPTETHLSEEELAAYANLHTYRGNTIVSNDALAHMELEYVMDAKKYIDSKISTGIIEARVG